MKLHHLKTHQLLDLSSAFLFITAGAIMHAHPSLKGLLIALPVALIGFVTNTAAHLAFRWGE